MPAKKLPRTTLPSGTAAAKSIVRLDLQEVKMKVGQAKRWTKARVLVPFIPGERVMVEAPGREEHHKKGVVVRTGEYKSWGDANRKRLDLMGEDQFVEVMIDGYPKPFLIQVSEIKRAGR